MACTGRCLGSGVLWVLWACVALPVRLVEHVVVGWGAQYLKHRLYTRPESFAAHLVMGLFWSYALFLPLARAPGVSPSALCTAYLTVLAWHVGHVTANVLLWYQVLGKWGTRVPAPCWRFLEWLYVPDDAGYLGLFLGLCVAFPVASPRPLDPSATWDTRSTTCELTPGVGAWVCYLPLGLLASAAACLHNRHDGGPPDAAPLSFDEQQAVEADEEAWTQMAHDPRSGWPVGALPVSTDVPGDTPQSIEMV